MFGSTLFSVAVGVTSATVRLQFQSGSDPGSTFCLAVKSDAPGQSTRSDGTSITVRECNSRKGDNDSLDFELADLWRIDSDGLLISHISGLCLNSTLTQIACTKDSAKWQVDQDGKMLKSGDQCVGVASSSLQMQTCGQNGTIGWTTHSNTLVAYPAPELAYYDYGSPYYQVTLTQGDAVYTPFVAFMDTSDRDPEEVRNQFFTNSFLTFSFEGEVTITVTRTDGEKIRSAVVRPLSVGALPEIIDDNSIQFKLSNHEQHSFKLSVELDDQSDTRKPANSLLIFADPLETDVPAMFGDRVLYINVGEQQLNYPNITSNTMVYVAGGAWVFAATDGVAILGTSTSSSLENIKVSGRGVISGKLTDTINDNSALVSFCGQNIEIEGITVCEPPAVQVFQLNAPWYCDDGWQGNVGGAHVHNVKLMGWNFADGIIAGAKSHVHHVFTRLNDDNVKPMMSDSVYENNVHWQGGNGWAIMLAWCGYGAQSNITVRHSTVIHDDHQYDYAVDGCDPCVNSQATIGAVQGGSGSMDNILIEDIVMESKVMRPIWFGIQKNAWANEGTGVISNWKIKNVQIMEGFTLNPVVWGADDENQVQNISFQDLTLGGQEVSTFEDAQLELHGHMQSVQFDGMKYRVEVV